MTDSRAVILMGILDGDHVRIVSDLDISKSEMWTLIREMILVANGMEQTE